MNEASDSKSFAKSAGKMPSSRDDARAQALRDNLMRRKAQARGRADIEAEPDKPGGPA